ncbi:ATP-dependent Clp protease ATP-binding subunit ClpA homolog CD4B, chloroplastic-like isoform X2 [Andrographis paniculata]|uniref:ATP-dependent Clp protease ATP-binding subunit ClpA homolog CD4B, chloroplastic-like isoform X2 n=1 Tax=Andrographis paniculata TaxID=175694 RepID=UPI0021E746A8|nr:ATP-dependent Clp protease ATP-binding subunit ClpA homolog CD4B, chloroplastic-like isoform X2 [Andrographis paniculata]
MALLSDLINLDLSQVTKKTIAEYIWIGGSGMDLRSKARTLPEPITELSKLPKWNYDGSSTGQATGEDSEVILLPKAIFPDPFRRGSHILVMCDTQTPAGKPIRKPRRHGTSKIFTHPYDEVEVPCDGVDQEYTLLQKDVKLPLGWPVGGFPGPKGPYYCGVGADKAFGRDIVGAHYKACLFAGINIGGINGENMPGQWEFRVGPAAGKSAKYQLLAACYILERITEAAGVILIPRAMFQRFTESALKVITLAQEEARQLGHIVVGTEKILLGLIGEEVGIAAKVLNSAGINLEKARVEVVKQIGRGSEFSAVDRPFTPGAKRVFDLSLEEARQLGQNNIGSAHLLLGLLREGDNDFGGFPMFMGSSNKSGSVAARVLENLGADLRKIRTQVVKALGGKIHALEKYGTNLTKLAEEGKIDPVVGRQEQIERVAQILGRRTKNNPCLIGEPGVGKTAIAEGLALRIADEDVPEAILGKKVITLDMALLVAGTCYRGQFEERLKKVMEEVKQNDDIILFIDEVHMLVGAGAAKGAMDAANIMKPALAKVHWSNDAR